MPTEEETTVHDVISPSTFTVQDVLLHARRIINKIDVGLAQGKTFDDVFDEATQDIAVAGLKLLVAGFEAVFSMSTSLEVLADRR